MSINIIIWGVVFLFVFTFLLVNLKAVMLLGIRILYGGYSYKYVNYYKSKYMKNPYPPCIKEDLMIHCYNFIDIRPESKIYNTNAEILFGSYSFYTRFSGIKKIASLNCYNVYKLSNKYTVKVVGTKSEILGNEIREIYYFINDIFFMGEYSFSDVSDLNTGKIIGMLAEKYGINKTYAFDSFYIRDNNDSLIHFGNNGFSISVQYINLRKPLINEVWDTYFKNVIKKETYFTPEREKKYSLSLKYPLL